MASDFKERFFDKRRFSIMGEAASACGYMWYLEQEELSQMQIGESINIQFSIKGMMAWLCNETETKYPHSTKSAR
jgi:hypothetical protein